MVKVKEQSHFLSDGRIDLDAWLAHLNQKKHYKDLSLIRSACLLAQIAGEDKPTESGESCLQQGLAMADILADLDLDQNTLAAAIVYDSVQYADLALEDIEDHLGKQVAKLVSGVHRMDSVQHLRRPGRHSQAQSENFRKMLIAMVDDVRVVLIKLAECVRVLRAISKHGDTMQQQITQEINEIYSPVANT